MKGFQCGKRGEDSEQEQLTKRQRRPPVLVLLRFQHCNSPTWRQEVNPFWRRDINNDPTFHLPNLPTWVPVWVFLCADPTQSRPNDNRRCNRSPSWKGTIISQENVLSQDNGLSRGLPARTMLFSADSTSKHFETDLCAAAHCDTEWPAFLQKDNF